MSRVAGLGQVALDDPPPKENPVPCLFYPDTIRQKNVPGFYSFIKFPSDSHLILKL